MANAYRHHFAEFCARLNYHAVVFSVNTGRVFGFRDLRDSQRKMPAFCRLQFEFDQIPAEGSMVFYGINLILDQQTIICSGSVSLIDIGGDQVAIVFYEPRISNFRDSQLPRIMWKDLNFRYLGQSNYVPIENNLTGTMVGKTDDELFEPSFREAFRNSDEAILTTGICFWDMMGKIRVGSTTTLVQIQKFPYYSLANERLGMILVYQPINQTGMIPTSLDRPGSSINQIIVNRLLTAANIFIAVQNIENAQQIETFSDNIVKLGYDPERIASGGMSMRDLIYPGDYDRYLREVQTQLFAQNDSFWMTLRIVNAKQEILSAKLFFSPITFLSGRVEKMAILIDLYDVTEEVALNYDKLIAAANRMHVVFTVRKMSSPYEYEIMTSNIHQFGYHAEDFLSKKRKFIDLIHPEDQALYRESVQAVKDHRTPQLVVQYRLISRKKNIYWLKETLFSTNIRGVEYLEGAILNITSTKAAFDTLREITQNQDLDQAVFDRISSQFNFASVLQFAEVKNILDQFAKMFGIDCALFNNYDSLMFDTAGKSGALDIVMKQLVDFTSFVAMDQVLCLYDNLLVLPIPVVHGVHRIGTLLCYAIVRDPIPKMGSRTYEDYSHQFKPVRTGDLKPIYSFGPLIADSVATVVFTAAVAIMQIQSQSSFAVDLSWQRLTHQILLDILDIANQGDDLEGCFREMMPKIVDALQLTRTSVFFYDEAKDDYSLKYEWFIETETSRRAHFQHVRKIHSFFEDWDIQNQNSFVVNGEDVLREKKQFRDLVHSVVAVRLMNQGKIVGFLNFVDNFSNRVWTPDEIIFFEDVGYILSSVIERASSKQVISQHLLEFIRSWETMPNAIAVITEKTQECYFANKHFWEIMPSDTAGNGQEPKNLSPAIRRILAALNDSSREDEVFLPESQRWFLINRSEIHFEGVESSTLLVLTDITQNKKTQETISAMAFTDVLTGLPNRLRFELDLKALLQSDVPSLSQSFICLLNIDNFRMINNTFSYATGDELLKMITRKLRQIPGMERNLYRFGGDEFILIADPSLPLSIYDFAHQVMSLFEKPFFIGGYETACTVSMGMVYLSDSQGGIDDLLRKVNLAMRDAKLTGKNRFVLFNASLRKYEEDTGALERALKIAVDEGCGEFQVFYQPIVSAKTGKIIGAEALIRWFSSELGLVSPVKFIPVAETTGLIVPIGKFILNTACKEAKKWLDYGYDIKISVNFSVIQTLQSDLVGMLQSALNTYRIPAKNLIFEVTESLAINDINKVIDILNGVHDIGVKIAMDDFGTGYSSLNHLRRMPLDIVKIDRSFIFNIEYDPYTLSFIDTIAKFCHMKNTDLCCEGVETETQKKMLQSINVDTLQGYLFGKPCSAEDFWKLLLGNK